MDDISGATLGKPPGGRGDGGWSLAEGDELGGYRVVRPLGRGGMGEVYLVRHEQMGKLYALKLISPERARDEEFRKRFALEARVMADLEHPNIVRVHYMGEEDGRFFLTMDYVEGAGGKPQSLSDLLAERGKLPETEARRIALDVARALEYSHCFGEGVVHRDLKPGNILIDAEGRARVTDFGLVRVMGDDFMRSVLEKSVSGDPLSEGPTDPKGAAARSQSDRALVGTYAYMAPEQKQGLTSPRSDIYALGLVIYRMLAGDRAEGLFALPSKLGCSVGWDGIMARTLAPKPEDRYRSAMELAGELEVLRVGRRGGGRKVALAAVAIGVLASVAVGGVLLYQDMARREKLRVEEAVEKAEEEKRREAEADRAKAEEEAKREAEDATRREVETQEAARREKEAKVASLLGAARTFHEAGLLDKAGEKLVEALAIDPGHSEATTLLAQVSSESAAKKAEAEHRKWMDKGLEFKLDGKLEEAVQAYEEAAKHAPPGSTEAADVSAKVSALEREIARREEDARRKAAYDAAMVRARASAGRGEWKDAASSCEDALARKPGDAEATRLLAQAKSKLGPAPTLTLDCGGGMGMELVLISAGEFMMGSRDSAEEVVRKCGYSSADIKWFTPEHPQHRVRITKAFYMGKHEVTQAEYQAVMGTNPSHFKGGNLPVETVSWTDATDFCRKLAQRTGREVRLPTEAEWEYTCRAGTTTPFHFGETITTDQVNYDGNYPYAGGPKGTYRQKTMPVGSFPANAWGLRDMHGNVWEWCADWYDGGYYAKSPGQDPGGPTSGISRVLRGGSWSYHGLHCRSAYRGWDVPGSRSNYFGFRVAVAAPGR